MVGRVDHQGEYDDAVASESGMFTEDEIARKGTAGNDIAAPLNWKLVLANHEGFIATKRFMNVQRESDHTITARSGLTMERIGARNRTHCERSVAPLVVQIGTADVKGYRLFLCLVYGKMKDNNAVAAFGTLFLKQISSSQRTLFKAGITPLIWQIIGTDNLFHFLTVGRVHRKVQRDCTIATSNSLFFIHHILRSSTTRDDMPAPYDRQLVFANNQRFRLIIERIHRKTKIDRAVATQR